MLLVQASKTVKSHDKKTARIRTDRACMDLVFVCYINVETCEKGVLFFAILSVDVICDNDTTGIVGEYLMRKQ